MILGECPPPEPRDPRKGPEYDSPIVNLLGQLQRSVDRAKAERRARTVRCDRTGPHRPHRYVATAKSGVDLYCPGVGA